MLSDQIKQAICWTLIHSLWQGLLLAVIAGAVIMASRKSGPVIRYHILSLIFFLFITASCTTFIIQYQKASSGDYSSNTQFREDNSVAATIGGYPKNVNAASNAFSEIFTNYFNEHASFVVIIWLIIITAQCIRLVANASYVQRIKHYKTHAPAQYWGERMLFLANKLGIKKTIRLLQSEIVKSPVVTGFFKPVILFPFGIMSQLPANQVEAVLLHELAHIVRKDYFVNMLQHVAEIFFFFNPGLLWVSSLIRDERENCCDDMAISETKRKQDFVRALVSFQEYNLSGSKLVLAFPGKKNHLLNRAKRILTDHNKTLNNMEKITLASGIAIICLITIAFTKIQKEQTRDIKQVTKTLSPNENARDTLPDKIISIETPYTYDVHFDGKKYTLKEEDGKVVELYVDGKKIANDKIGDYKEAIEKIHVSMKQQQEELQEQNAVLEKQSAELAEQQDYLRKKREDMKVEENQKLSAEQMEKLNRDQEELQENISALKADEEVMAMKFQRDQQDRALMATYDALKQDEIRVKDQIKILQQQDYVEHSELLKKQIFELKEKQLAQQEKLLEMNRAILDRQQNIHGKDGFFEYNSAAITFDGSAKFSYAPDALSETETFRSYPLTSAINQLLAEGLINSKEDLEFTLDNKILKVNGKLQPEELHARFKGQYLKSPEDHIIYARHGHSITGNIEIKN